MTSSSSTSGASDCPRNPSYPRFSGPQVKDFRVATCPYGDDLTSPSFMHMSAKPWDKQILNSNQLLSNGHEGSLYDGISRHGFINDILGEHTVVDDTEINLADYLGSQFPGFSATSLAEVYFSSGCDLNLTIEMLTQLELQVDDGFNENMNPKTLPAPDLTSMDFPALTPTDGLHGHPKYVGEDDFQQSGNPYRSSEKENVLMFKSSSSIPYRGSIDFASAVRKLATQDSGWKYERNGPADAAIGSSRASHLANSTYNSGHGRFVYSDRSQTRGSARIAPVWLETGDAVANMYSDLREEARDHACLRNAYFEQIHHHSFAPLIGSGSGSDFGNSPRESAGVGNSRPWFTHEELVKATNGFSSQSLLGVEGFGSVETISRIHHRHMVSLVGYCISENQRLLVYEF